MYIDSSSVITSYICLCKWDVTTLAPSVESVDDLWLGILLDPQQATVVHDLGPYGGSAEVIIIRILPTLSGPAAFCGTRIFTPRHGIRRLPLNLLLATEKCEIAGFLLHLYLIQGFSNFFLILPFTKQ